MYQPKIRENGFVLATMIVMSTVMIIIGITVLQTIVSIVNTYNEDYYTSLATQAAEAGVVLANTCAEKNDHTQTWNLTSGKLLTQKTDCTGTVISPAVRPYVLNEPRVRTSFVVGDLTARVDGALIIKSTGKVEILDAGGSPIREKTVVVNQMLTWPVDYTGSATSSGWARTCGVISKSAYCWGNNEVGQLGDGTTNDSLVPVKVQLGQVVTGISSGHSHNCVIAVGNAYCWGYNAYGQLGNGSTNVGTDEPSPIQVDLGGKTVTAIGTSSMSTCAIADGDIYCWGRNNSGQLGIGSYTDVPTPTKVQGLPNTATRLMTGGAGMENMCAVVGAGKNAYCWGRNNVGQVGTGSSSAQGINVPTAVGGPLAGQTIVDISGDAAWSGGVSTGGHVCAVSNAKAYCWGSNRVNSSVSSGELGIGATSSTSFVSTPTAVVTSLMSAVVTEIIAGSYHSCAIAGGEVYCWGRNNYGQLGDRSYSSSGLSHKNVPVKVAQDAGIFQGVTVTQLGGGFNRGCGVANQKTFCWGNNSEGQIGDGTSGNVRDAPTESIFLRPKAPVFLF